MVGTAGPPNLALWAACACLLACCRNCFALKEISVRPGHSVVLPCLDPTGSDAEVSEWRRPERHGEVVFWVRGRWLYQHLSFKGRVELSDPDVKDGDMSVVLKNADPNDAGTYECHIKIEESFELVSSVRLKVTDPPQIRAKPGADVTLPCRHPSAAGIDVIKWSKVDPEQNVFVSLKTESEYEYDDELHESFQGRVELKEPTMENGDVSVVLKNVSFNDSATYECYVRDQNMLTQQLVSTIVLKVHDSDVESGSIWNEGKLITVVSVAVVAAVHVIGICFLMKRKRANRRKQKSNKRYESSEGEEEA